MLYGADSDADTGLRVADQIAAHLRTGTRPSVEMLDGWQRDLRAAWRTLKPMEQYMSAMVQQAVEAERGRATGRRPALRAIQGGRI